MMQSVKKNLALRRGRDHFFDRKVDLKTRRYVGDLPKVSFQVRDKFRRKLAEEKASDRRLWVLTIFLMVLMAVLAYVFLIT